MWQITRYVGIAVLSMLLLVVSCHTQGVAEVTNLPKDGPHSAAPSGHQMPVHPEGITALALSNDGSRVAAGGYGSPRDGAISIYDFNSGRPIARLPGYDGSVVTSMNVLAFSPDGQTVLSGGSGGLFLTRVDSANTQQLLAIETGVLEDAVFSGNGSRIVAISKDLTSKRTIVHVIDSQAGTELRSLSLPGVSQSDWLLISPDGRWVSAGDNGDSFRLWAVESDLAERQVHLSRPMKLWHFLPAGDILIATAEDGRLHLLNALTRIIHEGRLTA